MTEKEKMIAGALYNPKDPEIQEDFRFARILMHKINHSTINDQNERAKALQMLLKNVGENLYIEPPFYCDYGLNIIAGKNLYMNFNCCILDVSTVTFGNDVMLGPNVQIYTATHPLEANTRISGMEYAKPISIGNNVWIGGNSTICPGVTLGDNVVVGAGAVVTKNFPANVVIAGNPAKIIKTIDNS